MPILEFFALAAEEEAGAAIAGEVLGGEILGGEALGGGILEGMGGTAAGSLLGSGSAAAGYVPEVVGGGIDAVAPFAPAGGSPAIPNVPNAAAEMASRVTVPDAVLPGEGLTGARLDPTNVMDASRMTPQTYSGPGTLDRGLAQAKNWWKGLSPLEKGMTAYAGAVGASALLNKFGGGRGQPPGQTPYSGPLSKYSLSPDFQPRFADPRDYQYTPHMYRYNEGGIASVPSYAGGGSTPDYYKMMTERMQDDVPRRAPSAGIDTGIYYDTDPDTQRADALTAAQIRMAKLNKRTGMQGQGMVRPQGLGQLKLSPVGSKADKETEYKDIEAAQGGIMQSSNLGGYAAGGNARLLKGPGDGMSDNIPAMIGDKQPARLADGEFVVPADVVSHLGNGSTDAGAKKLDQMMSKVRKARTGNAKQGKQINPDKYMPK